ncbi:SLC13 family permease [Robertkochia solimangrovi]|uniref:SLC13 family permease n=1 Tax=Robertkochia solimangrovi TaxID=2213046 RepID=UPI00117CDB13|nr:SLC13 family permease [Robertkochia solimangrovi]TRZ41794.1 SLC13 family permease [Robertkochia solimangrovi]
MILTLCLILVVTIALFIWGKYPPDVVALISMLSLYLTGILDVPETLSGFSNPTVIMVAALFIIGEGLSRTGWTALAGRKFVELAGKSVPKLLVIVTLGSGVLSGFVSNTGTVATLMPVSISAAWTAGTLPSKILLPVAYGSNAGGLLTLTGTPTNIIVSDHLMENHMEGFSFFEFGLIGIPMLILAIAYFRFFGHKLLPNIKTSNKPINLDAELSKWIEDFSIGDNVYRLRIRSMSPLIDTQIKDWEMESKFNVTVIRLRRRHFNKIKAKSAFVEFPNGKTEMRYHDIITVKGQPSDIDRFMQEFKLGLIPDELHEEELKREFINSEVGMVEVIVTPKSYFVGRTIPLGLYLSQQGIQLLGVSRGGEPINDVNISIKAGDSFIIRGSWEKIDRLKSIYENLVICGSPEAMVKNVDTLDYKSYISLGIMILMILLLSLNVMPGSIAVLLCAGIMMFTGCVPIEKAYKNISWTSVIMIAAMIPMGVALQKTGAAQMISDSLIETLGESQPVMLMGGIFILTTLLSQTINNTATAVLMAPIAYMAALGIGVSPRPFMMTVAVSASTAYMTPMGTTTNAMVMSAGGYKFMDYLKTGTPLLILTFLMSLVLIPFFWPFEISE